MRIPRSASIEQSSVSATTTPESWTDFFTGIRRAELYPRTREALAPSTSCNLTMAETSIAGTRVTTLELFFDLVFVFTITQLTAVVYHAPTLRALAQVVLMLGVIWWMYGGYAWMTNAVSAHTTNRRLLLLGGMGGRTLVARGRVRVADAGDQRTPRVRDRACALRRASRARRHRCDRRVGRRRRHRRLPSPRRRCARTRGRARARAERVPLVALLRRRRRAGRAGARRDGSRPPRPRRARRLRLRAPAAAARDRHDRLCQAARLRASLHDLQLDARRDPRRRGSASSSRATSSCGRSWRSGAAQYGRRRQPSPSRRFRSARPSPPPPRSARSSCSSSSRSLWRKDGHDRCARAHFAPRPLQPPGSDPSESDTAAGDDRQRPAPAEHATISPMSYEPTADRYEPMIYNRCGRSGLLLPAMSLGLWQNFGDDRLLDTSRAIVRRAFDLGITHFDLANNYGPPYGSAEQNFGRIFRDDLAPFRDELVISTKAGYDMWPGPYGDGGSRKYLLASLDQSLGRLGLDYVDIFYSHRFDPETPLEETIGALDTAVRQGKALYVGVSSYSAERTTEAVEILHDLGTPLLIHQPSYSMFNRWLEDDHLLDTLDAEGAGCIAFSPLAQGLLTNRYLDGDPEGSRAAQGKSLDPNSITEDKLAKIRALNEIAQRRGQTLAQLALAWGLRDPRLTSMLIGASSVKQLEDNVGALQNLEFGDEELAEIDKYATEADINL